MKINDDQSIHITISSSSLSMESQNNRIPKKENTNTNNRECNKKKLYKLAAAKICGNRFFPFFFIFSFIFYYTNDSKGYKINDYCCVHLHAHTHTRIRFIHSFIQESSIAKLKNIGSISFRLTRILLTLGIKQHIWPKSMRYLKAENERKRK